MRCPHIRLGSHPRAWGSVRYTVTVASLNGFKVSGKQVTKLTSPGSTSSTYLYLHDDVVYVISAQDETVAAGAFATLP